MYTLTYLVAVYTHGVCTRQLTLGRIDALIIKERYGACEFDMRLEHESLKHATDVTLVPALTWYFVLLSPYMSPWLVRIARAQLQAGRYEAVWYQVTAVYSSINSVGER